MIRRPPRSTRTDTLFPYTARFRSAEEWRQRGGMGAFADVMCLPFPDDSFDLVLGIEVLEHVPVPDRALSEIRRVGRESFVLSVPREPIWRMANVRSEERRVGKEGVSTCRSRWSPDP